MITRSEEVTSAGGMPAARTWASKSSAPGIIATSRSASSSAMPPISQSATCSGLPLPARPG